MFVLVSYVFSIKYVEAIKIYASLKAIPKQLSHLKKKKKQLFWYRFM